MASPFLSPSSSRIGLLAAFLSLAATSGVQAQGSASLDVTPTGTAAAGSTVTVKWSGPNAPGDYITVVRKGAPVNEYLNYQSTSSGRTPVNPVSLVLPAEPGAYEVRYVFSNPRRVLAAVPYEVTAIAAAIDGPASVTPGVRFEVSWTGPNNGGDWVTIVAAGAAPRAYGPYVDARNGRQDSKPGLRTAELRAPAEPGRYELRYVQQGRVVIGTRPIEVAAGAANTPGAAGSSARGGAVDNKAAGAGPASATDNKTAASGAAAVGAAGGAIDSKTASAGPGGATENKTGGSTGAGLVSAARGTASGTGGAASLALAPTWAGSLRCTLTADAGTTYAVNASSYKEQVTHTWVITGPHQAITVSPANQLAAGTNHSAATTKSADPPSLYDATWSVTGSGRTEHQFNPQPPIGKQYVERKWTIDVPAMNAPLSVAVSGGRLVITTPRPRLRATHAATGTIGYANIQSGCSGWKVIGNPGCATLSAGPLTFDLEEWDFPTVEAAAGSTRVNGTASSTASRPISPMHPSSVTASSSCTWDFRLVGGATAAANFQP